MVKCKNCGEEIENKNFCPKCGTKNETRVCPSCNNKLQEDDIFCPECGEKIMDDEEVKEESSEQDEKAEEEAEEKQEEPEDTEEEPEEKEDEAENTEEIICPHCNTKINEADAEYCLECGKPINIDSQSIAGINETIQLKRLIILSIVSIIFSIILSLLFSFILGMIGQNIDLYPIGFFISLFIVIAIFGSFKDLLNGGLLGIITGLVVGLLCNLIVEMSAGFAFSYQMFSGYEAIVFTIFGAIVGVLSTKYFRKSVSNHLDVEKLF
ncbi:zinc-ribbon domain-containing protein [Methanobrevibacter sp.]|uniref:zinc-ribbon domain-containing protein n=1 Tax=Methanobrevibacter sp. TaxID=66852 RepID=UPI00386C2A10